MTDRHEAFESADLVDATPDWVMVATVTVLVTAWLSWFAVTAYRLIVLA